MLAFCEFSFGPDIIMIIITDPPGVSESDCDHLLPSHAGSLERRPALQLIQLLRVGYEDQDHAEQA